MHQSVDGPGRRSTPCTSAPALLAASGWSSPSIALSPEGRTSAHCAGIWDDAHVEGLAKSATIIKRLGAVPPIQLGHTGRKAAPGRPWERVAQVPPEDPDGWQFSGPSAIPYAGTHGLPVHELTVEEIAVTHRRYADAARRTADASFEWLARDVRSARSLTEELAIDKAHHILADDEVGIAEFDCSATRHGELISAKVNELYTFGDGKIAQIQAFVLDMPEWDRAYCKD